jgi:hypothetical protein
VSRMTIAFVSAWSALLSTTLEICAFIVQSMVARMANAGVLINHVDGYVVLDRRYH